MAYLDAKAINAKLLAGDKKVELLNYIFKKQGGASCHLDYNAAATSCGIDRNTVRNYVNDLIKVGILKLANINDVWVISINPCYIKTKEKNGEKHSDTT
jgi:hypothetical protein